MKPQRIFITGGASGLGRALAERYAREGWHVCIGDIQEVRLQETLSALKNIHRNVHALRCDISEEGSFEAARTWVKEHWHGIDIVVNNAGVSAGGWCEELPLEDWKWILDINLLGAVRATKVFTELMRGQGSGHFVNIASAAGLMHMPRMASYNASKAALVALSETLRFELAPHGIKVSVVCPTFFRTNLIENIRAPDEETKRISRKLVEKSKVSAESIADAVYRSVAKGDFLILPDFDARVGYALKRVLPFPLYTRLMQAQFQKTWQRASRSLA